jgi:hypothetical protein
LDESIRFVEHRAEAELKDRFLEAVKSERSKVNPTRQPMLFELEKAELTSQLNTDRPYSVPGILLGTSAFTARGWEGSFYPRGMQSRDYLSYYTQQTFRSKAHRIPDPARN